MIPNCKRIYLCTPDRHVGTVLNGVQTSTVDFHPQIKGYSELSFSVDRFIYINGERIESNGYEDLKPYMYLYLEDIGFFQMQAPQVENDGNHEIKNIQAYSAEKEFENKDLVGIKINTGEKDSVENLYKDNIDNLGFAKRYVIMLDERDRRFSFLHIILENMSSDWTIGYIDPALRKAQIPNITIDNENLYAVMTSEVAPRLSCLFIFNYLNYTINVYGKDNIDFDTGIFIGFRNLEQNVTIDVDEDSIYTRFKVSGDNDLNVRYHNYGSDQIFNLDHFMCEPYMETETVNKIRDWIELRENYKNVYLSHAKEVAKLNEKKYLLEYTVPSDESYWKNWDNMNEEGLLNNQMHFNSLLESFQIMVDDRNPQDMFENYVSPDDHGNYKPKKINNEVNHEWYLQRLYDNMGEFSGYYTYKEIIEYVLPYIQLALDNLDLNSWEKITPEERGIDDPTEHWELYGYQELDGVRKSYEEDLMGSLEKYSLEWDDMTEEQRKQRGLNYGSREDYEESAGYEKYHHYKDCLGDQNNPQPGTIYHRLHELEQQIAVVNYDIKTKETILGEYNNIMRFDIDNVSTYVATDADTGYDVTKEYVNLPSSLIEERRALLFSNEEINLIKTLFHDTDYTNSNILTTSIDTVYTTIDKEKELLDDAAEKLAEVSQPQYTFSVSLDNLLRLPEFSRWYDQGNLLYPNHNDEDSFADFGLLRFIHVGLRDDYSVKLRVIGYRWNPCEVTPDLQIEFSNMITSKSGRSDLVQLLELENNTGSKNSISIGTGNSKSDQEYVASLLQVLTKNSIFTKAVSAIAANSQGALDEVGIQGIISGYIGSIDLGGMLDLSNLHIKVGNITGEEGEFDRLFANYLSADTIYSTMLTAENAYIEDLTAEIIRVGGTLIQDDLIKTTNIDAERINVTDAFVENILTIGKEGITQLTADSISTATINASQINGEVGDFQELNAKIFNVIDPDDPDDPGTQIIGGLISTQKIKASQIDAEEGSFEQLAADILDAGTIYVDMIQGDSGKFDNFFVNNLNVNKVFGQNANFQTLVSNSITTDSITAKLADMTTANVDTLFAGTAFVNKLSSVMSQTVVSTVGTQSVINLIAQNLAVSDLAAGNIVLSNDMQIIAENSLNRLIMNGDALQVNTLNEDTGEYYTAIQLGFGANDRPSLIICDKNGGVMLDSDGIHESAIANELIRTDMIRRGAITRDKIGFEIITPNSQGGINISQVWVNDEQFGVNYANFQKTTSDTFGNIENVAKYSVEISYDNGPLFSRSSIDSNLSCTVYEWGVDITEDIANTNFNWFRDSGDSDSDDVWNNYHKGMKSIHISSADLEVNSSFICIVNAKGKYCRDSVRLSFYEDNYILQIDAPNGTNINGGNITLVAKLYKNNVDITNDMDASCFIWTRKSSNSIADNTWNQAHSTGAKSITITSNDVRQNADFQCEFITTV